MVGVGQFNPGCIDSRTGCGLGWPHSGREYRDAGVRVDHCGEDAETAVTKTDNHRPDEPLDHRPSGIALDWRSKITGSIQRCAQTKAQGPGHMRTRRFGAPPRRRAEPTPGRQCEGAVPGLPAGTAQVSTAASRNALFADSRAPKRRAGSEICLCVGAERGDDPFGAESVACGGGRCCPTPEAVTATS